MNQIFRTVGFAAVVFVGLAVCAIAQQQDDTVYAVGNGVSDPILIQQVHASYTQEARDAKAQGTVELEAIVGVDGAVSKVQVIKSLGYGMDESAAKALAQWRFKPGTKDGKAVNVKIEVKMNFTLG